MIKAKNLERFTNQGCKNIPPNFKHGYNNIKNMYYIPPLDGYPLGANGTMIAFDQGSCSSNINGVNKLKRDKQSYGYCESGSDNVFDV